MKILLTVQDNNIAPRFDQATEVVIADYAEGRLISRPRTIILRRKSAEDISDLVVKEDVNCIICGGMEDELHQFFTWKKITVIDGVIGSFAQALDRAVADQLEPGVVLPSARKA